MDQTDSIVNRVAQSSLVTFDLEELYQRGDRVILDIKDQLFQGLILREKEFREFVKLHDWSAYNGKFVAITCSADAIIPTWAFMLVGLALEPFAKACVFGSMEELEAYLFRSALDQIDFSAYSNAKVVVKGCSKVDVPVAIYVDAATRLRPFAASIMFGEPCSTVPLYKNRK